jgi:hypothetical protein
MNKKTGEISIDSELIIGPKLTETGFLKTVAGSKATVYIEHGAHKSYKLPSVKINTHSFIPIVFFDNGNLQQLQLHPIPNKQSWLENEMLIQISMKSCTDWFLAFTGKTGASNFPWGEMQVVEDNKAGFSFIQIKYS